MQDTKLLNDYLADLQKEGFRVVVSLGQIEPTYAFFEKDSKVGYVQADDFFGLDFGTVNLPSSNYGTGTRTKTQATEPTIQDAIDTLRTVRGAKAYDNLDHMLKVKDFMKFKDFKPDERID